MACNQKNGPHPSDGGPPVNQMTNPLFVPDSQACKHKRILWHYTHRYSQISHSGYLQEERTLFERITALFSHQPATPAPGHPSGTSAMPLEPPAQESFP